MHREVDVEPTYWASLESVDRNARTAYVVVPSLALGLIALWVLMHIDEVWVFVNAFR